MKVEGPYSVRLQSKSVFKTTHQLIFEETPVRVMINVNRDFLETMVDLLNIAHNLGFKSGEIVGRMEERYEQTSRKN